MAFAHLQVHSRYSLNESLMSIEDMVRRANELNMPAIAITDRDILSGMPAFCSACKRIEAETGRRVKPIYGCEVSFVEGYAFGSKQSRPQTHSLILLAKNDEGYRNLIELVSDSHLKSPSGDPCVVFEMIEKHGRGLICISGGRPGLLGGELSARGFEGAVNLAGRLAKCFEVDDFYIGLENQELIFEEGLSQDRLNSELAELAYRCGAKIVAINDVHYLRRHDAKAQDILWRASSWADVRGAARANLPNDQFYMKSESEMRAAFAGFEEACDNTIEIIEKCHVDFQLPSLSPRFRTPGGEAIESWFRELVLKGLEKRYGVPVPGCVLERADYEMTRIIQRGVQSHFLIVHEYVEWARGQGIDVGPGLGMIVGSVVSYALGITSIEPLSYGLVPEPFFSVECGTAHCFGVRVPEERREEVIEHVKAMYGESHVIGTIRLSVMRPRGAVYAAARSLADQLDVSRGLDSLDALSAAFDLGSRICASIAYERDASIAEAMGANPKLAQAYAEMEDVRRVIDAAQLLDGSVLAECECACDLLLGGDSVRGRLPLKRERAGENVVGQYDERVLERAGAFVLDCLSLPVLDIISQVCIDIRENSDTAIGLDDIPVEDEAAFDLLHSGDVKGLFRSSDRRIYELLTRTCPVRFSDVVAVVALANGGASEKMGIASEYLSAASGRLPVSCYDPCLDGILEETYGVLIYLEQIVSISASMSGFNEEQVSALCQSLAKCDVVGLEALRSDWERGAIANGYSLDIVVRLWKDIERILSCGTPQSKANATGIAVLLMKSAYLKAHYPSEYMTVVNRHALRKRRVSERLLFNGS